MEKFNKLMEKKDYRLAVLGILIIGMTFSVTSLGLANTKLPEYRIKGFILCTGKIVFVSCEGGFFGILSDDGRAYDPINLPDLFKIDGLRVFFTAHITDLGSFHMWGKVIRLLFIL
ncbi:MAG: hypothetical protein R3255_03165 [Candidatus Lokiarchaeia archaeon]|nr:hypothetical protein [Candidatus Lokiarchaeia archaeon]